jgi:hypothetical protein
MIAVLRTSDSADFLLRSVTEQAGAYGDYIDPYINNVADVFQCAELCSANVVCRAFTYSVTSLECFLLKQAYNATVHYDVDRTAHLYWYDRIAD